MREPFRIQPLGPVSGYRTFGQRVTRRVRATCAEVGCEQHRDGWVTVVPPGSPDEGVLRAACEGRVDGHRRQWAEVAPTPSGFLAYSFPPGQPCLRASLHRVPVAVQLYHRTGDWRNAGSTSGLVTHPDAQSWVDEFGEHQQRVAQQRQRYGAE